MLLQLATPTALQEKGLPDYVTCTINYQIVITTTLTALSYLF